MPAHKKKKKTTLKNQPSLHIHSYQTRSHAIESIPNSHTQNSAKNLLELTPEVSVGVRLEVAEETRVGAPLAPPEPSESAHTVGRIGFLTAAANQSQRLLKSPQAHPP